MAPGSTDENIGEILSTIAGKRPLPPNAWIIVTDPKAQERALALAVSPYQRSLLRGEARLSLADLKGKARHYAPSYAASRDNLLSRLTANGVPWREAVTYAHGRRILVLGELPKQAWER